MSKHKKELKRTAGPWKVFDEIRAGENYGIDGGDGTAVVFYGSNPGEGIRNLMDARLIAAAPDLLDACKKALYALKGREHDGFLRDAIAKATGERE